MSFAQEIHRAVMEELKAQKQQRRSLWLVVEKTEILDEKPGQFIYRLTLAEELRVAADSTLVIKIPGQDAAFEVQVLFAAGQALVVLSQQPLPQHMAMVRVEFDPTFILKKLDEHLDQVLRFPLEPLRALLSGAVPPSDMANDTQVASNLQRFSDRVNHFQRQSVVRMQSDTIHLLWGPPGTGKTHTVGISIAEHLRAGKTCLLLSTSNAAVDEMVRAAGRAIGTDAYKQLFRAGATDDREIQSYTSMGLLERRSPQEAAATRKAEERLRDPTANAARLKAVSEDVYREIQECRELIKAFVAEAKTFADSLMAESQCVASTLATLVLNPTLSEREFDVVYIDEASMVSLPFVFAGAAQASAQVIFAGDFRQLPPICISEDRQVQEWFGRNVFDYLGVSRRRASGDLPPFVSMLREQYRMTERIAQVVSELSYGGKLITNKGIGEGVKPVFVDVSDFCPTSLYSVQESSYYQPHTAVFLNALCTKFREWLGPENLLLSPFRAQRAFLDAASKDLSTPNRQFSASTIHKAQGSQEHTVIVDLTAHSSDKPQKFFDREEAENLINVALSRAQQKLVVFGSVRLVQTLAAANEYWRRFWNGLRTNCIQISVRELVADTRRYASLNEAWASIGTLPEPRLLPSVYIESATQPCSDELRQRFSITKLGIKLVVTAGGRVVPIGLADGITYRESRSGSLPSLATWQGYLALPMMQEWTLFRMPETTKKLAHIACGHLYEAPFEISDTHRLLCFRCSHPLLLRMSFDKVILRCSREYCGYSRPMTMQDAQTLVEVQNLLCPICGSRPQPRTRRASGNVFLGCSNYPLCKGIVELRLYRDEFVR